MNCDTAFDLMTDANGSRSGALARHFVTCPRCRQMQETLAPALEFLTADQTWPEFPTQSDGGPTSGSCRSAADYHDQVAQNCARGGQPSRGPIRSAARPAAAPGRAGHALRRRLRRRITVGAGICSAHDTEKPIPAGQCTRQEAASDNSRRSADTIQALAQSFAVCHTAVPASAHDKKTSLFRSERPTPGIGWRHSCVGSAGQSMTRVASQGQSATQI